MIADGKRGDVPVTAAAYAQALVGETPGPFGNVPGLGADAFTANPLLGRDALEPLVEAAADAGAGCFVLVRTSNPGAADLQDTRRPRRCTSALARLVDELGEDRVGDAGLSSVGAVTGATRPGLLARLRELMPHAIFLLPGVGAQGGRVEDLGPAFANHPAGGLVTASRSIVDAHRERGGDPAAAAAAAAEELRAAAWSLGARFHRGSPRPSDHRHPYAPPRGHARSPCPNTPDAARCACSRPGAARGRGRDRVRGDDIASTSSDDGSPAASGTDSERTDHDHRARDAHGAASRRATRTR